MIWVSFGLATQSRPWAGRRLHTRQGNISASLIGRYFRFLLIVYVFCLVLFFFYVFFLFFVGFRLFVLIIGSFVVHFLLLLLLFLFQPCGFYMGFTLDVSIDDNGGGW